MFKKLVSLLSLVFIVNYNIIASASPTPSSSSNAADKSSAGADNQTLSSSLEITQAWARPSVSTSNNSAIYMTIKNNSDNEHKLVSVSAIDAANKVEIHQTFTDEKGVSKMVTIDSLVIPKQSTVIMQPGGIHIMLFNLKTPLAVGDKVKLQLKFADLPPQILEAEVKQEQ